MLVAFVCKMELTTATTRGDDLIMTRPAWYTAPEQQLAKARRLWQGATLPEPPRLFTPRTPTEILLLHVPDTFGGLWNKVVAPRGHTKRRLASFDGTNLRRAPRVPRRTKPVWLGFDPEHGLNMRPNTLWGQPNLAASEILSALIQFPDWPLAWIDGVSAPQLTGYQHKANEGGWALVPCLSRWQGDLRLHVRWAGAIGEDCPSPSVRTAE